MKKDKKIRFVDFTLNGKSIYKPIVTIPLDETSPPHESRQDRKRPESTLTRLVNALVYLVAAKLLRVLKAKERNPA